LGPTLEKAFALKDQLVFVDVYVDQSEHVYPMLVSPNGSMQICGYQGAKKHEKSFSHAC
jgi:thiamine pyrophosphate-dependent acetolactate synthase large subunit-like protein